VLAHDALVVIGAEPEEETTGAELVVTGPPLTLVAPGVGTIVVTMRRFTTFRITTGREAPLLATALSEGSLPLLSW
jgi:hypothetical protein